MAPGDRVTEWGRGVGVLVKVYEMTDADGNALGRKSAEVLFDGEKLPVAGVWLDDLHPEIAGLRQSKARDE